MAQTPLHTLIRTTTLALAAAAFTSTPAAAQTEIVLHAKNASAVMGDWQVVSDSTAAGGGRLWNPDRGRGKLTSALASPSDYFELTFTAEAGRGYRLWLRARADGDYWGNDSVFVQFSGATAHRIGTTDAATVSLEECSGCGSYRWGWNDNGWAGLGPVVYFSTTGPQKIRIQRREDGVSIDQIVLSASRYVSSSPGAFKNDSTVMAATDSGINGTYTTSSGADIIIPAGTSALLRGDWQQVADSTAANGYRVWNPERGRAKLTSAAADPTDYFDVPFTAEAGKPYRLWIRGKAHNNAWTNDSVFVQFSTSLTASGGAQYRIGTTSATVVSIERGTGQGLGDWGWEDNGWDSLGPVIYFETTGAQILRVQRREDGISIDQIVLSPATYLSTPPGAAKWDTTLLVGAATGSPTSTAPAAAPAPAPEPEPTTSTGGVPLRVLMWNVHHSYSPTGVYNIEAITTWIASWRPDVIALNEVEKFTGWGNEDQPARYEALIEAKTGRQYYSLWVQEFGDWSANGKGHLILSAYPLQSVGRTTITQSSGLKWAGAAGQATIVVNGRTVNVVVSHLDPYDQAMRLTQARDVIRWSSSFAENRIIVGDMNAWPDQTSILEFNNTYHDSWTIAANNGTATGISGVSPFGATKNGRIDYIFYSKNAANLVVLSSTTPDTRDASGVMASDHRPVLTTFDVR